MMTPMMMIMMILRNRRETPVIRFEWSGKWEEVGRLERKYYFTVIRVANRTCFDI